MLTFKEFVANQVDESQIDALYKGAHIAVELARLYAPDLLKNITVIGNLASGAYGVYNSGENRKLLPKPVEQALIYYGKVNKNNIHNIPKKTIRQYYPQIPENQIQSSDTIHVNIRRIMNELPNDIDRIIEITATILHESMHEYERENQGWTSEAGPVKKEREFKDWVYNGAGKQVLSSLLAKHRNLFQQQGTPLMAPQNQPIQQSLTQTSPLQQSQPLTSPLQNRPF